MPGMLIEFWSAFESSPAWYLIRLLTSSVLIWYIYNSWRFRLAVKGTALSYRSGTILRTLCLPLCAAFLFEASVDLLTSSWFAAGLHACLGMMILRDWERYKDNEDWWTGKGTKLKKKLRSMFTVTTLAGASAGA